VRSHAGEQVESCDLEQQDGVCARSRKMQTSLDTLGQPASPTTAAVSTQPIRAHASKALEVSTAPRRGADRAQSNTERTGLVLDAEPEPVIGGDDVMTPQSAARQTGVHGVAPVVLSRQDRQEVGTLCKRLIDYGRMRWLQEHHMDSHIVRYVDASISGENQLLLARSARLAAKYL
jgi:hypothetical protein